MVKPQARFLDLSTRQQFLNQVRAQVGEAAAGCGLVIDLIDVEFMDSTGVGALIAARNIVADGVHGKIELRNASPRVQKLLALSGLTAVLPTGTS